MICMSKPVKIYTTKTCGYCRATKEFLAAHKIDYTEIDVGADAQQARVMIEKSGQMGVPVTVVGEGSDEQLVIGYNKLRLQALLGV